MSKILGSRVVSLRKDKTLSQKDLLEAMHSDVGDRLSRILLSKIENDRYDSEPGLWLAEALAEALDTTVDYLIGREEDPARSEPPRLPVPEADIARMVDRLNGLAAPQRAIVARLVEDALELIVAVDRSAGAQTGDVEQLVRLLDTLSPNELHHWEREIQDRLRRATAETRSEGDHVTNPRGRRPRVG